MTDGTSDFIITISMIIGGLLTKYLPSKIKWWWRLIIGLIFAIILSILIHLIVKIFL